MSKREEKAGPDGERVGGALLAEWSSRYRPALLKFFRRRTRSAADQEDLVQEVFIRLAQRSKLDEIQDVDRYIFKSASNVLIDWRRHRTARHAEQHDSIEEDRPGVGFDPERVLMYAQALRRLTAVVARMPPKMQIVFTLYHFEDYSHGEIARALGLAIRTVEDHLARANARLLSNPDLRP